MSHLGLASLVLLAACGQADEGAAPRAETAAAGAGETLRRIRARGVLHCAIHTGQVGMSYLDRNGVWQGLFVDYCRALAAAVLGDPSKVRFLPVASNRRFTIVQTGEADLLSRTTTWTLMRDAGLGVDYAGIFYFDGQSFLVRRASGVRRTRDLDGAAICISKGTTAELATADYFARHRLRYRAVVYEHPDEAKLAFFAGRCDAMTTDAYTLTTYRLADAERPDDYVVLDEFISKAPQGIVVRSDDPQWQDINRWVLNALLAAEEHGLTRTNVAAQRETSRDPEIQRMLGAVPGYGRVLGLDEAWAYRAIRATGNYGEIWSRHIGPLGVPRGYNRLYRDGGLLYPLPMQ